MRLPLALLALALAACQPDASAPPPETTAGPPAGSPAEPTAFHGDFETADDGADDPGFAAFRDTLRAIVARRDTTALLALVGPGARLSFGDAAGGPAGLRAMWFDGARASESLWDVLPHVLDGGSVEEDGAFVAPSVAGLWPDHLDPFETVAVVGEAVPAYDAPGGTVIAIVSSMALPRPGPPADGWQPVTLPDGREAVLKESAVYSPVGYRLTAWDDGDGWKLQTLLAGD